MLWPLNKQETATRLYGQLLICSNSLFCNPNSWKWMIEELRSFWLGKYPQPLFLDPQSIAKTSWHWRTSTGYPIDISITWFAEQFFLLNLLKLLGNHFLCRFPEGAFAKWWTPCLVAWKQETMDPLSRIWANITASIRLVRQWIGWTEWKRSKRWSTRNRCTKIEGFLLCAFDLY